MPYSTEQGHAECDDGEVAVVKDGDGEVMGCHGSEEAAQEQIAALEASEEGRTRPEGLPLRAFADYAGDSWADRLPDVGIETRVDVQEMMAAVSRGFWRKFDDMANDEDYIVPEVHLLEASESEASGWLVAENRATERYFRAGWSYTDEGPGPAGVDYEETSSWTEVQEEWVPVDGDAEEMERSAADRKSEARADASDLNEGTLVTWGPDNATRYGEITSVVTSGETTSNTPGEGETTLEGSEDTPAFRIQHYEPGEDGWEENDSVTVHRADNLTVIDDFPERSAPAVHTGLEERGPQLGQYQRRTYTADVRRSSDGESTTVIINTDAVDGHGTIVDPQGMRLEHGNRGFSRNFFINHDMNLLAGESPEPQMRGGALQVQVPDSAWDHEDELVERWYRKVKKGLLSQASIGFMPIDGGYEEQNGERVYRYDEWMLREWSFVPIASNPEADVTSRTPASRLEQKIERLERKLAQVASEAPDSSEGLARNGGSSADKDPEGKATDDGGDSAAGSREPTRVLTVEDAQRLLREQKRKRREKAEQIAKRKLGMA